MNSRAFGPIIALKKLPDRTFNLRSVRSLCISSPQERCIWRLLGCPATNKCNADRLGRLKIGMIEYHTLSYAVRC